MSEPTYLTRAEAAEAAGCHVDTVRRHIRNGMPSRRRPDGTVEVAVPDLVSWGLIDPLAATGDITGTVTKSRAERDLRDARTALAVAEAKVEQLEARIRDLQDHDTFLRGLIKKQAA